FQQTGGGVGQVAGQFYETVQEPLNKQGVHVTAPVRRGDENHFRNARQWFEKEIALQQLAGFFVNLQLRNVCVGHDAPEFVAGVRRRQLRQQTALAVADDDHLLQRRVLAFRVDRLDLVYQIVAQNSRRVSDGISTGVVEHPK